MMKLRNRQERPVLDILLHIAVIVAIYLVVSCFYNLDLISLVAGLLMGLSYDLFHLVSYDEYDDEEEDEPRQLSNEDIDAMFKDLMDKGLVKIRKMSVEDFEKKYGKEEKKEEKDNDEKNM